MYMIRTLGKVRVVQAAPSITSRLIVQPWDTDGVKAELEKRGFTWSIDTSDGAKIHVAQYMSYHTTTPNGYNLQISYNTHDTRLNLAVAVNPRRRVK